MDLLHPMIVKEFRRTVPGRKLHRTRVKLGSLYALLFLVAWIAGPGAIRQLPSLLLGLPIYAALTSGFRVGGRLLAEELEEGQLEVLLTTPLTRFEVFVAKGVGQLFRGMHPVWMALPIYAFATAVGAFTPEQALLSGLYTIGLWALCVVLGCAATLKGTNSINATLTAGTLFALVSVPPVASAYWAQRLAPLPAFPRSLTFLSPLDPAVSIVTHFKWGTEGRLVVTLILMMGAGIAVAAWIWWRFSKLANGSASDAGRLTAGGVQRDRRGAVPAWMEAHPFARLAMRDRGVIRTALVTLAALLGLGGLATGIGGVGWATPMIGLLGCVALMSFSSLLVTYDLCHRIALERRLGTLELLLTSPVSPAELCEAQLLATRRRFLSVLLGVLGLDVCLLLLGLANRSGSWTPGTLLVYGELWAFLVYFTIRSHRPTQIPSALRVSFFTGRPLQALANPFKRWPWYYYVVAGPGGLVSLFQAVRDVPTGTVAELVVVNFALVVLLLVDSAMNQSPHRVQPPWVSEMRRIAAQPVPSPDDPRSKDWAGDGDWPPS